MKQLKLLILSLMLIVAVSSCKKGGDNSDEGMLYVKVENASEFSNVAEVKLMVYDRSIDMNIELTNGEWKDGGFTIELSMLDPNYCYTLANSGFPTSIANIPPTMTISNNNVKVGNVNFCGVDENGNLVTHFYPFIDENGTTNRAFYTYVDSDVTISGYTEESGYYHIIEGSNAPEEFKQTTTYSVKWEKGWNVWFVSRSQIREGDIMIITEQWSTAPVSGLKWYGSIDL